MLHIVQLFSSPHLSEALLSRECVRIGWPATAAKGRLGAPYFSWEKNQRDAALGPPPSTLSAPLQPFTRCRDLAVPELPQSSREEEGALEELLFDCAESWVGCREAERRRGGGKFVL